MQAQITSEAVPQLKKIISGESKMENIAIGAFALIYWYCYNVTNVHGRTEIGISNFHLIRLASYPLHYQAKNTRAAR